MKFLKDRTFWLMFIFFFLTFFFHGCGEVETPTDLASSGGMFHPPLFSLGFPFAYLITEEFNKFEFVWWGLALNVLFLFITYLKRNGLFMNELLRKYTFGLVLFHIILGLYPLLTLLLSLYILFYKSAPNIEIVIISYILILIILAIVYLRRKNILQQPKLLKYSKFIKLIYFIILILVLLPILNYILSFIYLAYIIFAGTTSNILYSYLAFLGFLGYGVITFFILWLPVYLLFLFKRTQNNKGKKLL